MSSYKVIDFKRLNKDCFWDYDFTDEEIKMFAKSSNSKEQAFLFNKILLNSSNMLSDLRIFSKSDLKRLIENYKVPNFNKEYIFRRKNLAEVYFLDKPLLIHELKWEV